MTECTARQLEFQGCGRRQVRGGFDGGMLSSDGGALLLREVEARTRIIARLARCFVDHRDPQLLEHSVEELLAQRVLGLALGYEDLNDHDELRGDHLLAVAMGKADPSGARRRAGHDAGKPLASSSTLNRLELTPPEASAASRYKKIVADAEAMDRLLIEAFIEAHEAAPKEVWLDLDATDDPLHGRQQGRFFHGYYGHYCYLPLYIFCADWLVASRLRRADQDASKGTLRHLEVLVERVRSRWPKVNIVLRADSGFARDYIMSWCEDWQVDYVIGLAKNSRLKARIVEPMAKARAAFEESGEAARVFTEFRYETLDSWSKTRRVVAKSEYLWGDKENPRFVVTSLAKEQYHARTLYEDIYCARGDAENRIREQLELFADQMSTHWTKSNQLRQYLSGLAYVFICLLRRAAEGVGWQGLRPTTIRLRLLKIGAQVQVTARRVWLRMASSCPWQQQFHAVLRRITGN